MPTGRAGEQYSREFITGIIIIPAGLLVAVLMIGMNPGLFAAQFIPVLVLCAVIALGLLRFPSGDGIRIFEVFARIMQILICLAFSLRYWEYSYPPWRTRIWKQYTKW